MTLFNRNPPADQVKVKHFLLVTAALALFAVTTNQHLSSTFQEVILPAWSDEEPRRLDITSFQCPKVLNRPLPERPPLPTLQQSTYAVSFPGSGDEMITKYLVEGMTGLYVGEASVSPSLDQMQDWSMVNKKDENQQQTKEEKGQGEVVALRTQFPHTSGKLASWDEDVSRAFVILRNPLHALPCYFNQLYEMNGHLPTGSSTLPENAAATNAAWIKWRDNQLDSQTMLYRQFISFWMEKFKGNNGNRVFFSYEHFLYEETGPQEASRLAKFLDEGIKANTIEWVMNSIENDNALEDGEVQPSDAEMSLEGTMDVAVDISSETMVDLEDVPCLWKDVVYDTVMNKGRYSAFEDAIKRQQDAQEEEEEKEEEHKRMANDHCGDWVPSERPYTPENLAAISQMLLELMNRWSRHRRLLSILSTYRREANWAYLASVGKLDEAIAERDRREEMRKRSLHESREATSEDSS